MVAIVQFLFCFVLTHLQGASPALAKRESIAWCFTRVPDILTEPIRAVLPKVSWLLATETQGS